MNTRHWPIAILLSGFAIAAIHFYDAAFYEQKAFPDNTFLFDPMGHFSDGLNDIRTVQTRSPYLDWHAGWLPPIYPPFAYLQLYFLSKLAYGFPAHVLVTFSATLAIILIGLRRLPDRSQALAIALVLTFFNYPLLLMIDRGNTELLAYVWLAAGVLVYQRRPVLGSILFGLAAATKIAPALLLLIPLAQKHWKGGLAGAVTILGTTLISLLCFQGSIHANLAAWTGYLRDHASVHLQPAWAPEQLHWLWYTTGIWDGVRVAAGVLNWRFPYVPCVTAYRCLSFLLPFVAAWQFYRNDAQWRPWEKVTALVCMIAAFPFQSYDYKLVHLVAPLVLCLREHQRSTRARFVSCAVALVLVPKGYTRVFAKSTASGIVNPLLLIAILVVLLWPRARPQKSSESPAASAGRLHGEQPA